MMRADLQPHSIALPAQPPPGLTDQSQRQEDRDHQAEAEAEHQPGGNKHKIAVARCHHG